MNLKDFVAESLKEIVDGVKDAQVHAASNGAEVCPSLKRTSSGQKAMYLSAETGEKVAWVDYDIAVTAEETNESGGGGKLSIRVASIFNAEGEGKTKNTEKSSSLSRLQFRLAIVWPLQQNHEK